MIRRTYKTIWIAICIISTIPFFSQAAEVEPDSVVNIISNNSKSSLASKFSGFANKIKLRRTSANVGEVNESSSEDIGVSNDETATENREEKQEILYQASADKTDAENKEFKNITNQSVKNSLLNNKFFHKNKSDSAESSSGDDESEIESITPQEKVQKQSMSSKLKSLTKRNKKSKKKGQLQFKKHSLTEIDETRNIRKVKESINKDDFFKHDAKNKLYLDRFKTYGSQEEKATFYEQKEIFENENGDIERFLGEGRDITSLMNEIEQTNPDEADAKPIDISLKDSIAIAIAKHPGILSAKLDTEIYRSRIIQEWASYFPTLSASVNWGHDTTKYHGENFSYGYNSVTAPSVNAGMLLFDFGKTKASADMAKTDYDASRYNLQDYVNEIIYSIKSAYFNVLFAQKQVEVYNNTIEDFDLQLASARKYFSIGKKPQIDVLTAEYNAGNARLDLVKATNELETERVTFANTLGLPEFANFNLNENLTYVEYELDLENLLQDAFNIRPDLLSQEKSLESAYLNVRRIRRMFTPNLNANGGLSYSDVDDSNTSHYSVGVDLSYTGFNFLQLKKDYDIAKKSYERALANYESTRQQVYLEVKQAYIEYNNSKEGVKQAELNVEQAKAQHYHATGRYKAGFGDAIEIKDAENTYLNAQLAYYRALLSYNMSLAQLEKVVGRPVEKAGKVINQENKDQTL